MYLFLLCYHGNVVAIGFINNEGLAKGAKAFFGFSLGKFGWLYQLVAVVSVVVIAIVTCSKLGDMRIGGANAKPKYPFGTWFAMTLTGGIAVGIVNWGINEPLIYYGNVYGELDQLGIQAGTQEAARLHLADAFITGHSYLMPCMRYQAFSLPTCISTRKKNCL